MRIPDPTLLLYSVKAIGPLVGDKVVVFSNYGILMYNVTFILLYIIIIIYKCCLNQRGERAGMSFSSNSR